MTLTLSTKSAVRPYGQVSYVRGRLLSEGSPVAGAVVKLYARRYSSSTYSEVKFSTVTKTGSTGAFSFPAVRPSVKTYYYAYVAQTSTRTSAKSAIVAFDPRAWVGTPVAPSSMSHSKYYSVYGYLKPRHTSGSSAVRIYKYRWNGKTWVYRGYVTAKVANYSSFSKYSAKLRLPYTGRWRLKAYHDDAGHAPTWSSTYDSVTVK